MLRGLRTLDVRMRRQGENGLAVANWLAGRAEVGRVLHPALPGDPGHAIWSRDVAGASGLFGFTFKGVDEAAAAGRMSLVTGNNVVVRVDSGVVSTNKQQKVIKKR